MLCNADEYWAFAKNTKKIQKMFKILLLKTYKNGIIHVSKIKQGCNASCKTNKEGLRFMKKTVKKLTAVGLTLTSVMGLVACDGNKDGGDKNVSKEVKKPEVITIMVDNTVVNENNGAKEFEAYLEGLLEKYGDAGKIDLQFTRPDHSGYYDAVARAFNGKESDIPNVVLLSSDYYALYASNGMLWDMTDAWNNSETKKSGRLIDAADKVLSGLLVNGEDGTKSMYGFSPYRGNGCCTYLKKSWLDKAGIDVASVEGKTLTFNEYYDILKKMRDTVGHYVISAPDFISAEAPYTNYLPEFYQKAQYTFYKSADGKYVDGFTQQEMKDALQRIQTAVKDNVIDKASLGQKTSDARDKFYSTDPANESGVFTYWAGTWADTLKTNLESKGLDSELIAINPIKELGTYVERIAPAWCITNSAKNPEGIFKYFIDTMLDGGDVQMAWEYGAKGTHWDDKAETVTLASDPEGKKTKTYTEGQFHFLPSPEKPNTLMKKNHIDPTLALATFGDKEDPGNKAMTDVVMENAKFFDANSSIAVPVPMNETFGNNITDINKTRNEVIAKVALGDWIVDDAMKYYTDTVGAKVNEVLESLNEAKK